MSWDCPGNKSAKQISNVAEAKEETINALEKEETHEIGESLMLKRILVKSEKETSDLAQRKILFRIICNSKGKCCKVVIESGSMDNLVSTKMVEKWDLKRMAHHSPYRVS
jgi:hypothetical protein